MKTLNTIQHMLKFLSFNLTIDSISKDALDVRGFRKIGKIFIYLKPLSRKFQQKISYQNHLTVFVI